VIKVTSKNFCSLSFVVVFYQNRTMFLSHTCYKLWMVSSCCYNTTTVGLIEFICIDGMRGACVCFVSVENMYCI